jgi:hypothetical protein
MEVINDRHDRGSTIVATQIPQDRWHEQIGDPTYADAILDRLVTPNGSAPAARVAVSTGLRWRIESA